MPLKRGDDSNSSLFVGVRCFLNLRFEVIMSLLRDIQVL